MDPGIGGSRGGRLRSGALSLAAGGLSALAFEPMNLWPMAFLGLAVLMEQVHGATSWRQAWGRGWVFGVGQFIVAFNWIAPAFGYQSNMPQWLGWVAVLVVAMYLAVFPALAGVLAWRVARTRVLAFTGLFAAAWMMCEWLRANLFTGVAWNPLGVVWLALPGIVQAARWIGTYGLSALLVLTSGVLWMGCKQRLLITLAAAALLTVGALAVERRAPPPQPPRSAAAIAVRIVQPNIGQDEKYDKGQADRHARLYASLSGAPTPTPRLLLWPESATLRYLELEPQARAELAALLGPHDLLLTGGVSVTFGGRGDTDVFHNSVFALRPSGDIQWRYDKAHLVPFGEYLPVRPILERLGLSRLVPGEGDFAAGSGPRTFPLRGFGDAGGVASVGVQICYEIIFSGRVVDEAHRPWFVFNPSNDAWFGAWGPPQHLAQARLRAIEEGLTVIRATPNGISALISPAGRILDSIALHHAGVIDGYLSPPPPPTLFSRFGNWTCALLGVLLAAVAATELRAHPLKREPVRDPAIQD